MGLLILFLFCGALPASAHVSDTTGYSTIRGDGQNIRYTLSLEYDVLAKTVDIGPQSLEAVDDSQRRQALESGMANLEKYLDQRAVIFLDGAACEPRLTGTSVERREGTTHARLDLVYRCHGSSGAYRLKYGIFSDTDGVADDHKNIVDYRLGGESGRTVLDGSHKELVIGENSVAVSSARFGSMGVTHILSGLDHVLFVIALSLGAANVRNLLSMVSMFTLAHSITLITALMGGVNVPSSVVEPLIALSIAFVAMENLLGATRRRLPMVFLFGLMHGLGFAGSLRITDEVSWGLLTSLLSFNVGIEAGQAMLLLAVFPLLLLVRRGRWSVPVVRGATSVVAAFGLLWFVERFFLS
jgi:hydrogenase/urease accessory protein HupE